MSADMSMLLTRLHQATQTHGRHTSSFELGELLEYDPATATGQFELPMHQDKDGETYKTYFIPCGTMFAGPAYGAQFPPDAGAQALVIFMDERGFSPVAAVFLPNLVDTPPFPDGKTAGWLDKHGSAFKTTADAATPGDGRGGARQLGAGYAEQATTSGHKFFQDDYAEHVRNETAGGHYDLLDDAGRVIRRVTVGGLETIHDDAVAEISHLASHIGLGDRIANLDADLHAALNKAHLGTFNTSLLTQRLSDMIKMVTAFAPYTTNPSAAISAVTALVLDHIPLPNGSVTVKIKP